MSTQVLLLNADYRPMDVIGWEKAITLLLQEKVELVADYAGKLIRSPSVVLPWPAVVVLKRYVYVRNKIRYSRANIMARDDFTCQYCGHRPRTRSGRPLLEELNVDHVVPRSQGVNGKVRLPWSGDRVPVSCWENTVCSCVDCNARKADRTPAEAGLTLRTLPRKPGPWETVRMAFQRARIPDEWKQFAPPEWQEYWDAELTD